MTDDRSQILFVSAWWMMTGRALNYRLGREHGSWCNLPKNSFQNMSCGNSAGCFLSVTTMETIDLGFSYDKCLINTRCDLFTTPDTPVTNRDDGLMLKMLHMLHVHSQPLQTRAVMESKQVHLLKLCTTFRFLHFTSFLILRLCLRNIVLFTFF